jgi:hypothetical protein
MILLYYLALVCIIVAALITGYMMKRINNNNQSTEHFKDLSEMQTEWQCYPVKVGQEVKYALARKDLQGQVQCATTAPISKQTSFDSRTCPKCPTCPVVPAQPKYAVMPANAKEAGALLEPDVFPESLVPPPPGPPTEEEKAAKVERAKDQKELVELTKATDDAKRAEEAAAADNANAVPDVSEPITETFVNTTRDSCIIYNSMTECVMSKNNMHMVHPYTCNSSDRQYPDNACTQLGSKIWQCVQDPVSKNYGPVRKNDDGDVECLGHTGHSCAWTKSALDCTNQIRNIPNTDILSCGQKYKDYFGSDAYLDANHWCSQFKKVLT